MGPPRAESFGVPAERSRRAPVSTFRCAIVTPTEQVLDEDVTEVEFPQWDGQRGLLKSAAPFVGRLGVGLLRIRTASDGDKEYLLNGGFAELHDDKLVLLADEIMARDTLDAAEARKRLDAAIEALTQAGIHDLEARDRLDRERQVATAAVALSSNG
ncbi:MAG: ATP synthase F1 subunit epsilon [Phycisphaerae bacterium]|nr:ATP synthase F1 subunit epsilon [Phycisphaerae bacterium]